MAKVTFIIGNGFDLSLDMNTSYREFYEHVKARNLHSDNRIYKAIQESPENWADFELSLGLYTSYIEKLAEKDKKAESIKFHEELIELMDDLADYLEHEEVKAQVNENLHLTNRGFFEELPIGQKDRIGRYLEGGVNLFQFISLNYTHALDQVVANSKTALSNRNIQITPILHIHGDLSENLTLGVSDETQLSQSMSGAEQDDLIKPNLIYSMNDGRIDIMNRIVEESSIIVLYGTSIGETDKYIWEVLIEWLSKSPARHIIIHKYDVDYMDSVRRSSRRQKQFTSNVQDKLLRYSGVDGDGMVELRNRIFVIHNTKQMFA
jgi:Bacteriophage abortive infection AbiH